MRKILLIAASSICVSLLLLVAAFYLWINGDIPQVMSRNEFEYLKTLDIQPSFGIIRFTSSMSRDPTYFYRLHLSESDFEATYIAKLPSASPLEEYRTGPLWWKPSAQSRCFVGSTGRHGFNIYFYDAHKGLLIARCEM